MVVKIDLTNVIVKEVVPAKETQKDVNKINEKLSEKKEKIKKEESISKITKTRPYVLNAKVYKLKSNFVKNSIFITLGYIEEDGKNRPFEIFINSKDLSKAAEFAVLTRLISAIFRKTHDPSFILDELKSIHDPNGGYFKNGKYIHSLYAEIAEVMEEFFVDIGLLKKESDKTLLEFSVAPLSIPSISQPASTSHTSQNISIEAVNKEGKDVVSVPLSSQTTLDGGDLFRICPQCNMKTLKIEEGCYVCMNPECNYSKCD